MCIVGFNSLLEILSWYAKSDKSNRLIQKRTLPLFDNLTYGNTGPHIWWIRFDDVNSEITFTPKAVVVRERIWPGPMNDQLALFFRESMCLELYWEDDIKWRMETLPTDVNPDNKYDIWPVPHPDTAKQ